MSDALASLLADLKQRLERELAAAPQQEPPAAPADPPAVDLWDLSEQELDRAMNQRLQRLHDLLPAAESAPAQGRGGRLRRRLAGWIYRLVSPVYGPYRDLTALLTELGLAAYIRLRLQEQRQDDSSARIAGLEEELALLRRRLDGEAAGGHGPPGGE